MGVAPRRRYDPEPLVGVAAVTLTADGVCGETGAGRRVLDVHNRTHPASKNRGGGNGISIGFTSHYRAMRERFGDHLADGIAGENILVEVAGDGLVAPADLSLGVVLVAADGTLVRLDDIAVAAPCVEFARYALRLADDARSDRGVTEALQFLHGGMRGYYATYRGPAVTIGTDAVVSLP